MQKPSMHTNAGPQASSAEHLGMHTPVARSLPHKSVSAAVFSAQPSGAGAAGQGLVALQSSVQMPQMQDALPHSSLEVQSESQLVSVPTCEPGVVSP
jgi:hypothetical protein